MTKRKIQHTRRGARFVWRVSKNTGKRYKQYLSRKTKKVQSSLKRTKSQIVILGR